MDSLDFLWVQARLNKFTNNVSWQREEIETLFEVYSNISKKKQKPTGCSRCVANARSAVYAAYQRELKKRLES